MSVDVTSLVMDRYFINELKKDIDNKNNELAHRWTDLQRKCTHPTIKVDEKYYRGGYDYVSSVKITHYCTICDKIVKSYDDSNHIGYYE